VDTALSPSPPAQQTTRTSRAFTIDRQSPLEVDAAGDAGWLFQALIGQVRSGASSQPRPPIADAFDPFKEQVKYRWDDTWLYV